MNGEVLLRGSQDQALLECEYQPLQLQPPVGAVMGIIRSCVPLPSSLPPLAEFSSLGHGRRLPSAFALMHIDYSFTLIFKTI